MRGRAVRCCIVASAIAATYTILMSAHGDGGGFEHRDGAERPADHGDRSDDTPIEDRIPVTGRIDRPQGSALTSDLRDVADANGHLSGPLTADDSELLPPHSVVMGMLFVVIVDQDATELAAMNTAIAGWVEHVLIPQHNLHVTMFYDPHRFADDTQLALAIGLERLNATHHTLPRPNRFPILLVAVPHWRALAAKHSVGDAEVCAVGATPWFVEVWLAMELFLHPVTRRYDYVARIAPDTRFFRRPRFPLIGEMRRLDAKIAHLGPSGVEAVHRCSQGGVRRLDDHQGLVGPPMEDRFVVLEIAPLLERKDHVESWVTKHISAFSRGLRAMDLWVSAATSERGAAQWQWMQWRSKVLRKNAVLYHSQTVMSIDELKRWTRLRWSRVVRERVEF